MPEKPVNCEIEGRARSTVNLTRSATANWPPTIGTSNGTTDLESLRRYSAAVIAHDRTVTAG